MAELVAVTTLLVALATGGFVAHLLRMPPPLGYLAVGVGLTTIGEELLPHSTVENLAHVGVLLLLFWIGIELDLRRLREALRKAAATIPFDIPVPALLIAAAARIAGWSVTHALALGVAASVSSTLFGERLTSLPGVSTQSRQRVVGVLVTEDVAAGALIALLVALGGASTGWFDTLANIGGLVVMLIVIVGVGLLFVPRLLDGMARRHAPELLVLWTLAMVVLFGLVGSWVGSAELGALLAGVAAAEAGSRYVARNAIQGLRDVAGALFFFGAGLAVDLGTLGNSIALSAVVAALFIAANIAVHIPAAVAAGLNLRQAMHTAFALTTFGEFSLILIAVAETAGVAHPDARTVLIGAMLLLLPAAALLMRATPALETRFWRTPRRIRKPLVWLVTAIRRDRVRQEPDPQGRRAAVRRFAANLMLVLAWGALVAALESPVTDALGGKAWSSGVWWGGAFAVGLPLLIGAYQSYRELIRRMVGLGGSAPDAMKVRSRIIDAWVAATAALALVPVALVLPGAAPVLGVAAAVAVVIGVLAWRALSSFHNAMEGTLSRVLGDDGTQNRFMDQMIDRYPWGVRFMAVSVPPGSPVIGQTLGGIRLSSITGATVAVLQRGRTEQVNPDADTRLRSGDTMVLVGDAHQLARAEALIVAHGDAVRLSAQSSTAQMLDIPLTTESPWDGKTLAEVNVRGSTGCLVIGVWEIGDPHPRPYSPDIVLDADDRLILLGTPFQLDKARILATGEEP